MNNQINTDSKNNTQLDNNLNTDLIYDYTEHILDKRIKGIDNTVTRLSTFLGFAGVLLKFTIDLPGKSIESSLYDLPCLTCLIFKIVTCILATSAIISCGRGLLIKEQGRAVEPKDLKEKYSRKTIDYGKFYIINTRIEKTIPDLESVIQEKSKKLNQAIILLCFAAITFATNIIIMSIFY